MMLKELIHYNHIANFEVINTFLAAGKPIPEAERLFSHILNAQLIWTDRINNIKPQFDTFYLRPVSEFAALQNKCTEGLNRILSDIDLSRPVSYANTGGGEYINQVSDILYHVTNHSTYHRAQIATLFRVNNVKPPVTDFIILKREGKL